MLLGTFGILFETNSEEASKETDGLNGSLKDTESAAKKATDEQKNLDDQIGKITGSVAKLALTYLGFQALASSAMSAALESDSLAKFTGLTGESAVEVDAWGAAVERAGGDANSLRGSVASLSNSLEDIKWGGSTEILTTLSMIGVSATDAGGNLRSAFSILPDIASAFERMTPSQSANFGRRLGLDEGTIMLLQSGRRAVDDLVSRQVMLGNATDESMEVAEAFNDQWADTARIFSSLSTDFNTKALPVLTDFLSIFEDIAVWMRENSTLVEGFFIGVAGVITAVFLPSILSIAGAVIAATWPFLLLAAGIALISTGIALLYEDFQNWRNGTRSLLGNVLGNFEDFKNRVLSVFRTIAGYWQDMMTKLTDMSARFSVFFGIDTEETPEQIAERLKANLELSESEDEDFFDRKFAGMDDLSPIKKLADDSLYAQDYITDAGNNPFAYDSSVSTISNRNSNVSLNITNTIDARGSDNTAETIKTMTSEITRSLESSVAQLQDGVLY